jgi:hypothetical protein
MLLLFYGNSESFTLETAVFGNDIFGLAWDVKTRKLDAHSH